MRNQAKVLIVDDDEEWQEALRAPIDSFTDLELDISVEKSRLKAQVLIAKDRFDLVILNVRLEYPLEEVWITRRWSELMYVLHELPSNVMVVTSRKYPPSILFERIMYMAFSDYEVKGFWIKEDFDREQYRQRVWKVLHESIRSSARPANPQRGTAAKGPVRSGMARITLSSTQRTFLTEQIVKLSAWDDERTRKGFLLDVGLPAVLVEGFILDGNGKAQAAMVVNKLLENAGFLVTDPEYTCLGLLLKYLYQHAIEMDGKYFCADIICELNNAVCIDQEWLNEVLSWYNRVD